MNSSATDSPLAWFHFADAYFYDAAILSAAEKPSGGFYGAPVRYLYFHAVELYLKSYLILNGLDEKTLRHPPYSHSLAAILQEAINRGLPSSPLVHSCCEKALNFQQQIQQRYVRLGATVGPNATRLHDSCAKLRTLVEREFVRAGFLPRSMPKLPLVHAHRTPSHRKLMKSLSRRD